MCLLRCSETAEDSIEPRVREVGARFLNLDPLRLIHVHTFVGCNHHVGGNDVLTATVLLVYATHRATDYARYERSLEVDHVYRAMVQWVREGARGHRNAMSVLDSRWARDGMGSATSPTITMRGSTLTQLP